MAMIFEKRKKFQAQKSVQFVQSACTKIEVGTGIEKFGTVINAEINVVVNYFSL